MSDIQIENYYFILSQKRNIVHSDENFIFEYS